MTSDERLDQLIVEWDQRRQAGEEVSAEMICVKHPELLPEFQEYVSCVRATDWLMTEPADDVDDVLTSELQSSQTLGQFSECVLNSGLITVQELSDVQSRYPALAQDAVSLAEVLIREQNLTRFQAMMG